MSLHAKGLPFLLNNMLCSNYILLVQSKLILLQQIPRSNMPRLDLTSEWIKRTDQ